jgi:hypothetical protein
MLEVLTVGYPKITVYYALNRLYVVVDKFVDLYFDASSDPPVEARLVIA